MKKINVSTEIGQLRRIMIHSPDGGIGKVIPDKAQAWLYDDIVDLQKMREEYDLYVQLLLYFLDPEKIIQYKATQKNENNTTRGGFYNPDKPDYFKSDKVIDVQFLLSEILKDEHIKLRLVAAVCGIERCSHGDTEKLLQMQPCELAKTLITGVISDEDRYVFPPIPNLIFTRDTAIVINGHLLITRPATAARFRESLIVKHLAYYYFYDAKRSEREWDNIIEITDDEDYFLLDEEMKEARRVSIEGGDMMMIAPRHLLVGYSERTSPHAINQLISQLFGREVVDKITVVKIPRKRGYMHIDTIFTMVKRNVWVMYGPLSKRELASRHLRYYAHDFVDADDKSIGETLEIYQYNRFEPDYRTRYDQLNPQPRYLEDLFTQICREDFNSNEQMQFIYSGGGKFPYDEREQWTDSCNLLAIKEGVVIGYDRNYKTAEAFEKVLGFRVARAAELIAEFENGTTSPEKLENTLILLPSSELSRARGGSHCMSMPLLRDEVR